MSALGQKQTSQRLHAMSALPPKADMAKRYRGMNGGGSGALLDFVHTFDTRVDRIDKGDHGKHRRH